MNKPPAAPAGLGPAGRKLWRSITDDFEGAEHETAILEEACRTRDLVATLRDQIETDGLMLPSSQGMRLHPAVAEVRQQRLTLARLLATLSVPALDEDQLPPARGVRGVYQRGAA
ncbi:hypothetical protein [Tessaracoccus sp. Z1128]